MQKLSKHILCLIFLLLPIMMRSQALPSLGVAKEITKGTLPNGIDYYLVSNSLDKGFADYALVRMEASGGVSERESLEGLEHFGDRKPWRFLSENGVGYGLSGYYTEYGDAGVFNFSNVPVYNQSVADSTLLMIVDMIALSRSPQAVVISGDIEPAKLKERLQLMSMMVPQLRKKDFGSAREWNARDSASVLISSNSSKDVAAVSAIYRSARLGRDVLDSPQPIITSSYAYMLGAIVSGRVERNFRSRGLPLGDIRFRYYDSASGPYDERYSFTLFTSTRALNEATSVLAAILGDLDRNGALVEEFIDAKEQLVSEATRAAGGRQLSNSEYVRKCISSFLYGSNLASEDVLNSLLTGKSLTAEKELPLFNAFVSALLDRERNLTLRFDLPYSGNDGRGLRYTFSEAWNAQGLTDNSYKTTFNDTLSLYAPKSKVKLKSEITEPISNGKLWTFSNGVKVLYKKTDAKGEFHYSLMLRGGVSAVPGIGEGESAFVGDMLGLDNIAGLSPYDFKAMLAANGITMRGEAGISDMRISGIAPKSKLQLLLRSLLSISEKRSPNAEAFEYYKKCEAVRTGMEAFSPRDVNSLMDSIMRPEYFYTGRKYMEKLHDDLPERAEQYFEGQFSKVNDGLLVLMGDLDEEGLKRELCKALGSFRTMKQFAKRPAVKCRLASGSVTYTMESSPGLVGGGEIGVNVAMAAPVPFNMENYVAWQLAVRCIRNSLVKVLAPQGAYFEMQEKLEVYPVERLSLFINCHPCMESGLPAGMSAADPVKLLNTIRKVTMDLSGLEVSESELKAFKEELLNAFDKDMKQPETVIDAVMVRYSDGKDLVSGYRNAVKSVNAGKVKEILRQLGEGAGVEYVII